MSGEKKISTNHKTIKEWTEKRGGKPAKVKGTGDGDAGVLRVSFPDNSSEEDLQIIPWSEFFEKFDKEKLALIYQEENIEGEISRFSKLVDRDNPDI